MTFLQEITLRCPVCNTQFQSLAARVIGPFGGRRTDFREDSFSPRSLPYLIHVCMTCGFAGESERFDDGEISRDVRDRVWCELATQLAIAEPDGNAPFIPGSEKYESAAKIAGWEDAELRVVGELWLRAAWCCEDENDIEAERYFRRKAAWTYAEALDRYDAVPAEERAPLTYLVGELWRRIGDDHAANTWFGRVAEEIVDAPSQEYILSVARRQAEKPEEWLP